MNISYRTRQTLRRSFSIVAAVIGITLAALLCLLLWLQRFVVYTDHGVVLNFDRQTQGQAQLPQPSQILPSVTIRYDDSPFLEGLQQLSGYYIPEEDLMKKSGKDLQDILDALDQLPEGTPVMLDIKGYRGYFYYSTQVGDHTSGLYDMDKMDELLRYLAESDLYVIARMSSLRDFVLVWDNSACGLTTTAGKLYSDQGDYGLGYWLDPSNNTVQNYLIDVLGELKAKGFDEVILQNFCFPDTEDLSFKEDKTETLNQLAQKLMSSCAGEDFTISFSSEDPGFVLPEGRCRLYLENIPPENAQSAWEQATMDEKRLNLVFIAPGSDSRYNIENGILVPLN